MFEDKYPSIFLSQMAAIVFIVHIFLKHAGDFEYHSATPQL